MELKKIIWICSFANEEVASMLKNDKKLFASPWITDLIELFREREDIELTIISPNYYSNNNLFFKLGNIKVHLTKYRRSFIPARAYNLTLNYNTARNSILKIVKEIKPDLIHLHGSENPFYSASALSLIDTYPVLITIQGFVFLSARNKNLISEYIRRNRIRIERNINHKGKYFTLANKNGEEILRSINRDAIFYYDHYPTTQPIISSKDFLVKEYDLVYYARLSKSKGIEEFIEAVHLLKQAKPAITAIIIGGGSKAYVKYLTSSIKSLALDSNIKFAGFQPSQQDVFKLAAKAKVYVLPTHFDGIPGSIREAMFMKIPVVANAVGGIPSLNDESECITLVEKGDIGQLVEKIKLVLDDSVRTERLVENAFHLISDKFDNSKIYNNLLFIYKDILKKENETVKRAD